MVADKVTVISKAYGADEAWQWESSGADGYELTPAEKETAGTDIILHIKGSTDTDNYENFLDDTASWPSSKSTATMCAIPFRWSGKRAARSRTRSQARGL